MTKFNFKAQPALIEKRTHSEQTDLMINFKFLG
jgi:hypothetical protein